MKFVPQVMEIHIPVARGRIQPTPGAEGRAQPSCPSRARSCVQSAASALPTTQTRTERSLDPLRRQPAVLPKKLRPELTELFKLQKGTKVFPSLKRVHSLSDSEFYSDARERVHMLLRQGKGRKAEL